MIGGDRHPRAAFAYQSRRAAQRPLLETLEIHLDERHFVEDVVQSHDRRVAAVAGSFVDVRSHRPRLEEADATVRVADGRVVQDQARHVQRIQLLELRVALAVRFECVEGPEAAVRRGDHLANRRSDIGAAVGENLVGMEPKRRRRREDGEVLVLQAGGDLTQASAIERQAQLQHRVEGLAAPVVGECRTQRAPFVLACERPGAHQCRGLVDRGEVELADGLHDVAHGHARVSCERRKHHVPQRAIGHVDRDDPGMFFRPRAERLRRPAYGAVDALVAIVIVDDRDETRATLRDRRAVDRPEV